LSSIKGRFSERLYYKFETRVIYLKSFVKRSRSVSKNKAEMSITIRANSSTVRICISESGFDDCVRVIGFCFIQIIFSIVNSIDDMIPKSRISTLVQKLVFAHKKSRSADSTFIMSKVPHVPQLTPVRFLCVNQLR